MSEQPTKTKIRRARMLAAAGATLLAACVPVGAVAAPLLAATTTQRDSPLFKKQLDEFMRTGKEPGQINPATRPVPVAVYQIQDRNRYYSIPARGVRFHTFSTGTAVFLAGRQILQLSPTATIRLLENAGTLYVPVRGQIAPYLNIPQ